MFRLKFHEFFHRSRSSRRKSKLKQPARGIETLESRCLLSAVPASELSKLKKLGVDTSQEFRSNRLIVTLDGSKPPANSLTAAFAKGKARLTDGTSIGNAFRLMSGIYEIQLQKKISLSATMAMYQKDRYVKAAEVDYAISPKITPNDSGFGSMWGLNNTGSNNTIPGKPDADIDAAEAWNITTGSGRFVVAIIDTGVDYTHPDLVNNIWVNPGEIPGNRKDDDGNGFIDDVNGWDFGDDDNRPTDQIGHGTHVAGTVAAEGGNGIGTTGVLWHAKIMPVKIFVTTRPDTFQAFVSAAIRGIDYAVKMGAKVSNNSWGFSGPPNQGILAAVTRAQKAGHIFVAAAGNDALNNDIIPDNPSGYNLDNVVAVAASDRNDELAFFSNYGPTTVDLAAPGHEVYSTFPTSPNQIGDQYGQISGTSMASPHVAGAIALLWDKFPSLSYKRVIKLILDNVDPIPELRDLLVTGGRLNINSALLAAGGKPSTNSGIPGSGDQPPNAAGEKLVQASNLKDVALADVGASRSTINIDSNFSITDLNVWVDVSHTYVGQLRMTLYAPNNSVAAVLVHRQGGGGDHFSVTTFDDSALELIDDGKAPFAGSFQPRDRLSVFNGINTKGTWKLLINDYQKGREGVLKGWGLVIRGNTGTPPVPPINPTGGSLTSTTGGSLTIRDSYPTTGTLYTVWQTEFSTPMPPSLLTAPLPSGTFDFSAAEAVRIRDELYASGVSTSERDDVVDLLAPLTLDEVAA